jgi:hypothetical protein
MSMTEQEIVRMTGLVQSATRNVNDYDARMIAIRCIDAKEKGENGSVWHQATKWFHPDDYASKCPCFPCSKTRGDM